jgi:BTB/POZ domain
MITLSIGVENPAKLCIHKDVLCASAPFFANATKGDWKEAQDRVIPLPEDDPHVVLTYIHWLYTGVFFTREDVELEVEWERLTSAYIFGDKVQDGDYKDATIDALTQKILDEKSYPIHKTRQIYENTVSGDSARRLWVDWFVYASHGEWMDQAKRNYYTEDFLFDLAQALMKTNRAKRAPYEDNTCVYHVHGQKPCYKNRSFP